MLCFSFVGRFVNGKEEQDANILLLFFKLWDFFVYLLPKLCCHCVRRVQHDVGCMFIGTTMNFLKSDVQLLMNGSG